MKKYLRLLVSTFFHFCTQCLKRWEVFALVLGMIIYAATLSYYSILRHNAFYSGFDLANMDQTIWNTISGNFFELTRRATIMSRFSIHADLILVVLSPLYLIWNNVRMLLIAQSVILALGAIPVYLLTKKLLKNTFISLLMVIVYLVNPWLHWINMYDFHGVSLGITFRLFALYFALNKQWRRFFIVIFLSLLTKESVALSISILGLLIVFVLKERKVGIATFVIGVSWFVVMVFGVIPYFSRDLALDQHWAFKWYQFNTEVEDVDELKVQVPMIKTIFDRFFLAEDALPYYYNLLKSFAFIPLLGFSWLILGLPTLTINMMSSHAQMRGLHLHYHSGLISTLTISTIFGLYYLKTFLDKRKIPVIKPKTIITLVSLFLLLFAIRVSWKNSPLPYNPNCYCQMFQVTSNEKEFENLLQSLPSDASITSSPEIRPHVTHRRLAYTMPNATSSAEYIAIIDQNRLVGDTNPKGFENELLVQLLDTNSHMMVGHVGHFYLFKRNMSYNEVN